MFVEYVWLDGYDTPNLRSKTKIMFVEDGKDVFLPEWSFDGSSTRQAAIEGINFKGTDCILKPVYVINDPFRGANHKIALCEVYEPDGITPHQSNTRRKLAEMHATQAVRDAECWMGWEQEYTLMTKKHAFAKEEMFPLGFNDAEHLPRPQGEYYCAVGSDNVIGRQIAEKHAEMCLRAGISICGINAEVLLAQWEYQLGIVNELEGCDQLWLSRYILHRVAEEHGVIVSIDPKPKTGDWNGSGCHLNFSTAAMRADGGLDEIHKACEKLEKAHKEHIAEYGNGNERRLSGFHETSSIDEFSYGESERNTSVRIPVATTLKGKGYFEDRRPASSCDPYRVSAVMLKTVLL
jgi:glutamine synthetase